jgi:hypothetical protein
MRCPQNYRTPPRQLLFSDYLKRRSKARESVGLQHDRACPTRLGAAGTEAIDGASLRPAAIEHDGWR